VARTLLDFSSDYQNIHLEKTREGVALYLDGFFQFGTDTEKTYHALIATLPLAMSALTGSALILGGGDGLALRNVLKYPVHRVVLVELDPAMVALAKRPPVSVINQRSFFDPRVETVIGDAKTVVPRLPDGAFDVIVADFPAATSPELKQLYTPEFYTEVFKKLSPGGVFVTQVSEPGDFTTVLREYLRKFLGHSFSFIAITQKRDYESFTYGSRIPLVIRRGPTSDISPTLASHIGSALTAGKNVITLNQSVRKNRV